MITRELLANKDIVPSYFDFGGLTEADVEAYVAAICDDLVLTIVEAPPSLSSSGEPLYDSWYGYYEPRHGDASARYSGRIPSDRYRPLTGNDTKSRKLFGDLVQRYNISYTRVPMTGLNSLGGPRYPFVMIGYNPKTQHRTTIELMDEPTAKDIMIMCCIAERSRAPEDEMTREKLLATIAEVDESIQHESHMLLMFSEHGQERHHNLLERKRVAQLELDKMYLSDQVELLTTKVELVTEDLKIVLKAASIINSREVGTPTYEQAIQALADVKAANRL